MKNIKYTLLAVPDNPDDIEHAHIRFKIYGDYNNVDWAEGPRRERITNDSMDMLVDAFEINGKIVPDDRRIFFGFNKEWPKIHRKIMEYTLTMKSDPKRGSRIKRGDFKRFEFNKAYTGGVSMLTSFVERQLNMAQESEKVFRKYGAESVDKAEKLVMDAVNDSELRSKLPLTDAGSYDYEKLIEMANAR